MKSLKMPDFLRNQTNLNAELRTENAELRRQLSETASLAYLRLQTLKKWEAENLGLRKKLADTKASLASHRVATDENGDARPFGE